MTRVALVADLVEENWPSMDLVADMTLAGVRAEAIDVWLVRPTMVRRFSRPGDSRSRRYTADRLVNRLWDYPRALSGHRSAFDVFHVIDHSYSQLVHVLPPNRTVVTCHDLDTFRSVLEPTSEPRSWPFRMMTRRILRGFQKAARVACDSEATRAQIVRYGLIPPERLVVAPLGLHPVFLREPDVESQREIERLLGAKHGGAVEILHVGSAIRRKRIDVVLETFERVRRAFPGARLLRVGGGFTPAQDELVHRLGLHGSVRVLPKLGWNEVAAVYRRADVLLLTSEREGFGLAVLEALACGTPVIASDIPALRETGGAVATYCRVGDVEAWVSAVMAQLRERGDLALPIERQERIAHARKFGWSDYARRMVEIYRDVLADAAS